MGLKTHILDKNLMVLASAGSGKTHQLGGRIIGMIGAHGVDPERMVALTFTRKAAGEFIDSVLIRLAKAALDEKKAQELTGDVNRSFEVEPVLEKVVKVLPRFQLGTIDSFFSRIVRGFQHELGISGGSFELIEGARLKLVMGDLIQGILGEMLDEGEGRGFVHAFRRATAGKEQLSVLKNLEEFMKHWHGFWKAGPVLKNFGGKDTFTNLPEISEWESQKHRLFSDLRTVLDASMGTDDWTQKNQEKAFKKMLDRIEEHTIGSGSLNSFSNNSRMFALSLEQVRQGASTIRLTYQRKEFELKEEVSCLLDRIIRLVSSCELAAAVERTEGIGRLIKRMDKECEDSLRNCGLLSFDDVKNLLGEWEHSEAGRLRRESVDFRLDGRFDHWFLDEFQDTSPAEWNGLQPLLDEAVSSEEGSLFVVGDKKQAIYGFKGGDISLFDRVRERFNRGMTVETMEESFRSCPAVLDLVNGVCGDRDLIGSLFGEVVANRWEWKDHVSASPDQNGEARVETVAKEDMNALLVKRLHEVGIGKNKLTCGVLLRTVDQVRKVVDYLKMEGFNVIEEGRRNPMTDSPAGVAIHGLIQWLANPADRYAEELILMSPLNSVLEERFGDAWYSRWEGLLEVAHSVGYATMVEELLAPLWDSLSEFSRHRVGDIVQALEECDASGPGSARGVRDWLADLEVGQAPGEAAVQVMTIHKAKGLGFEVVMIPHLSDNKVPNFQHYNVAKGKEGWLLDPPPAWVRQLTPELEEADLEWEEDERYEALCQLYVALTRAKRGLYVFVPVQSETAGKEQSPRASLANLVRMSVLDSDGGFQSGESGWTEDKEIDQKDKEEELKEGSGLGEAVTLRSRMTPSSGKIKDFVTGSGGSGMKVGSEVHELFEAIAWLEEGEVPRMPRSRAGMIVEETLSDPEIHRLFEKDATEVELYREQALDVIQEGKWLSGIVDRMHVWHGDDGNPEKVIIIDYKTDSITPDEIAEKYAGQMTCYRKALVDILGVEEENTECVIVSTANKALIELS
ncbi:MAG: UvrD-helicase domain-containing protein [Verrucomicrobiota bacterium]|nr:UvrD-helicase domain-containing protein [Verrucomicrobiota bacterium]